jgi:RNA polymerase sigma-70 factor (ECF subfamily)
LAADLMAETFATVLLGLRRFDPARASARAWTFGIAQNKLLRRLPSDQAQAVRARVIEEQTYAQIARHVACSESVIRKRVSRGLANLRAIVKEGP